MTHWSGLEERFLEGVDAAALRLRHLLLGSVPLGSTPWRAGLANELFLDLESKSGGPQRGFGETRVFAGVERAVGEHLRLQAGYQLQWVDRPGRDAANHLTFLAAHFSR